MNKILVTGSNGQLGSEIRNHFKNFEAKFYYTDQNELDILDFKLVESFIFIVLCTLNFPLGEIVPIPTWPVEPSKYT